MKIEVNSKHAIKGLTELHKKVNDLSPLMRIIAGFLADVTEDAFEGEYNPTTGQGWAGLLPSSIKQRRLKGTWPGKILQDSGQLATSIVTDYGSDFAEIGTNKIYGASQQFGVDDYPDRSGSLEPRPFIGLSNQDIDEIEGFVSDYLKN